METTVNTNNDNIMSSSIGQASSKPNGQASHQQFNDYMYSRGTGERLGLRRHQNDLDKTRFINQCQELDQ